MLDEIQVDASQLTASGQVTTLVVLENELVRCGIFNLLRSVPSVGKVWACGSLDAALDLFSAHRPNIVLCHGSGDITSVLVQAAGLHGARILLLLEDLELEAIDEAIMLAASGFLLQSDLTAVTLHEAVTKLSAGDMPLPASLARTLMVRVRGVTSASSSRTVSLTPREQQVLSLLAQGLSNKQIARRLTISEHGVKRHVTNLLAKLNCPNRTLAVALALQDGLV